MTTDPIPNCPQPETPIRERAWTPEQLERRAKRLDELSDAVANGLRNEFTMRVPAEPDRDADLVLQDTARIVRAYADTLSEPADSRRVDGAALLQIARDVGLREVMFNVSAECAIPLLQAFFAAVLAAQGQGEAFGWVIPDGEGDYFFRKTPPSDFDREWADKYNRHYTPVFDAPPAPPAGVPDGET